MLCRCKISKIVMYYTLRTTFKPKCPAYYTSIVKGVNRSESVEDYRFKFNISCGYAHLHIKHCGNLGF